ncbi:MAG TPA: S26 family signal peptidase, partial [Acidimicrobiales bacterium]|nr:S26 family signal peptidase [Acidimicrobiales bacterium]
MRAWAGSYTPQGRSQWALATMGGRSLSASSRTRVRMVMTMLLRCKRVLGLPTLVTAVGCVIVAAAASALLRRVEVQGDSMRPTLLAGDRLLVLRLGPVRPGDLVVVADPRQPDRRMVKRVAAG